MKNYLSDHFHLSEACKSQTAIRLGIENIAPASVIGNLKLCAERILEPIRDEYGEPFSPTSWYRCPKLNTFIGGSQTSAHRLGLAVDIELIGWDNADFAHWCAEYLDYDQLILEYYQQGDPQSGWVHIGIQINERDYRNEFKTAERGTNGKTFYRKIN